MRWASGSAAFESPCGMAFGAGADSWAAAEGPRKPEPAGVAVDGFVTAGFFLSAGDPRRVDFAGGGLGGGGGTTSVWGGVEAGPECQVGLVESARLESEGGRAFDPSCGAPTGIAAPRKYIPAPARASQLEASVRLTRVVAPSSSGQDSGRDQLSAPSRKLSARTSQRG